MDPELSGRTAAIAARFLQRGAASGTDITNMKLQKLVALTESLTEHIWQRPALPESVRAWRHGPAVKELYIACKRFGETPITGLDAPEESSFPHQLDLAVGEVWDIAGHIPAGGLWKLTHEIGPYQHYYEKGEGTEIPKADLGRAWPDYVTYAQQLTAYRSPVNTPVVGIGQAGFRDQGARDAAVSTFRPSRLRTSG
ncbi:Panacea domain-containing protein [Pseudolysinimonas sp.]|jgi:uncharacterized phage-associated protein|uniref:Panacea domain-containing protein n=1 Tax=Pseudolysinimonas sp. TaxID=2680009 RepID=UPI003783812A